MYIYNKNKNALTILKEIPFKLEKEIQSIFESNLQAVLNLQLVKSEFTIKNNRIDTLGKYLAVFLLFHFAEVTAL